MSKIQKNSFVLYHNFFNQISLLDMQSRGELFTAIFEYETCGVITTELSPVVMMAFSFIKDALDRDKHSYEVRCRANIENSKSGGRPKKNSDEQTLQTAEKQEEKEQPQKPNETQKTHSVFKKPNETQKTHSVLEKPKKPDNDNDIDNENENENENENDIVIDTGEGRQEKEKKKKQSHGFANSCDLPDRFDAYSNAPHSDAPLSERDKKYLIGRGLSRDYIEKRLDRIVKFAATQNKTLSTLFLEWWVADGGKLGPVAEGTTIPDKPLSEYDDAEFFAFRVAQAFDT